MSTETVTYTASPLQYSNWSMPEDDQTVVLAYCRNNASASCGYEYVRNDNNMIDSKFRIHYNGEVYRSYAVERTSMRKYKIYLHTAETFEKESTDLSKSEIISILLGRVN